MKTIIVATDFSYNANNALEYAAAFAASTKANLILFNAFQLSSQASNTAVSADSVEKLLDVNLERLQTMAEEITKKYKVPVSVETRYEIVTDGLKELVAREKADLVVMGMHVIDWPDRLFGNTTTAVIREADYPVLVVPQNASFKGVNKILYAFDNTSVYYNTKLSLLKKLAENFGTEVQVFHVRGAAQVAEAAVVETQGVAAYETGIDDDAIVDIEKGVEEFDADMVALVPQRLTFWEDLMNQSTTRAMALRTQVPLLVLPNSPKPSSAEMLG